MEVSAPSDFIVHCNATAGRCGRHLEHWTLSTGPSETETRLGPILLTPCSLAQRLEVIVRILGTAE